MERRKILIVVDEVIVARDLYSSVNLLGYFGLDIVLNSDLAIKSLSQRVPDLVIIDVNIRGSMDGIDLANYFQKNKNIPTVIISAYSDSNTIKRIKQVQPYGYLLKPISNRQLKDQLEIAFDRFEKKNESNLINYNDKLVINTLKRIDVGVIATNSDGIINFINLRAQELTGYSREQAIGKRLDEVYQTKNKPGYDDKVGFKEKRKEELITKTLKIINIFEEVLDLREFKSENKVRTGLVVMFDLDKNTKNNYSPNGNYDIKKISGADRKNNLNHLLEKDNSSDITGFAEFLSKVSDGILLVDDKWRVVYSNKNANECLKIDEDSTNSDLLKILPSNFIDKYYNSLYLILNKKNASSLNCQEQIFENDFIIDAFLVNKLLALKLTKYKKSTANITKHDGTLEKLAGGFAHEFNNYLTIILGNLSLAEMQLSDKHSFYDEVKNSIKATKHAQSMIHQLLAFSKGKEPFKQEVIINNYLKKFLTNRKKIHSIEYKYKNYPNNILVNIDKNQINRLLENLIINSEQSINENGKIIISLDYIDINLEKDKSIFLNFFNNIQVNESNNNEFALIKIKDNGCGIEDIYKDQIFNYFFTERKNNTSSGLGLTVGKIICDNHEGYIDIKSTPKVGTIVSVLLPIVNNKSINKENNLNYRKEFISNMINIKEKIDNIHTSKYHKEKINKSMPKENSFNTKPLISDIYKYHDDSLFDRSSIFRIKKNNNLIINKSKDKTKVLILEDEILIRKLMVKIISKLDCDVEEAGYSSEAIKKFQNAFDSGNPFKLFVTDLQLDKGLDGNETFQKIRQIDPKIKALVSSGYSDNPIISNYKKYGFSAALPKPYNPQDLSDIVKSLLDKYAYA